MQLPVFVCCSCQAPVSYNNYQGQGIIFPTIFLRPLTLCCTGPRFSPPSGYWPVGMRCSASSYSRIIPEAGVCVLQLPGYCLSYSNIQGQGINLPTVNPATSNSPLYTPQAPSPPGYVPVGASCTSGPCINTCCTVGPSGFCLDNLLSQGGHYAPGEMPHVQRISPNTYGQKLGVSLWEMCTHSCSQVAHHRF